ncbi:hypothetical protein BH11GEM2_BH11GEM2_26470 [soil metagenome]
MAPPKGGTPIETGLIGRIANGLRYMVTGTTEFFGPGTPIEPAAQDQAHGRAWDFPVGVNMGTRPRASEATDFATLRALADNFDLVRLAIETRKDQMGKLRWQVQRKDDGTQDDTATAIQRQLLAPDGEHDYLDWLRMLLEDLLVIDAPTVYIRPTRGGQVFAFEQIDGATINRMLDARGRTPTPPAPGEAYDPATHGAYQQVIKGLPATYYHANELIYKPRNPRIHKVFGFSPVEQLLLIINIGLRRQAHQLAFYTAGNIPDMLMAAPATWSQPQIESFQKYWDLMMAGDLEARRKLRMVPSDLKPLALRPEASLFDLFDEWIARVVCYCFSLPPSAFVKQQNRATAETAQEAALQEGLSPLMEWTVHFMNRLIAKGWQTQDYTFAWTDEPSLDPLVQAQVDEIYARNHIRRVNEIRDDHGWEKDDALDALQASPPPLSPVAPTPGHAATAATDPSPAATPQPGQQAEKLRKARSRSRAY